MDGPKEKHDQQKKGDDHLALQEFKGEPIELGGILQNRFQLSLDIITERQEQGEGIRNRIRSKMLHERRKHFKPPTVILSAFVFEEKTDVTILHGQTKLAFPGPTCFQI